jgi:hypothetical protein
MIKIKINSNKNYSLFVFCLIIGGLFFTNINNNVLGAAINVKHKELTEDQRTQLVTYIMDHMSVKNNKTHGLQAYLSQLSRDQGWHMLVANNMIPGLVNNSNNIIILPTIMKDMKDMKDSQNIICDVKSVTQLTNDLPGTLIAFNNISISYDADNDTIDNLQFSLCPINSYISNEYLEGIKNLSHKHGINWNVQSDHLYLKQILINQKWKNQLEIINKDEHGEAQIIEMSLDKFTEIPPNTINVYNNEYQYVNPEYVTSNSKKKDTLNNTMQNIYTQNPLIQNIHHRNNTTQNIYDPNKLQSTGNNSGIYYNKHSSPKIQKESAALLRYTAENTTKTGIKNNNTGRNIFGAITILTIIAGIITGTIVYFKKKKEPEVLKQMEEPKDKENVNKEEAQAQEVSVKKEEKITEELNTRIKQRKKNKKKNTKKKKNI